MHMHMHMHTHMHVLVYRAQSIKSIKQAMATATAAALRARLLLLLMAPRGEPLRAVQEAALASPWDVVQTALQHAFSAAMLQVELFIVHHRFQVRAPFLPLRRCCLPCYWLWLWL